MPTPYVPELDELRWEVARNTAGVVSFFPKVPGTGNVTATTATYELFDPLGNSIGTGSATIAAVGTPSVSRIDVPVPALATLDEDYQARIVWRETGGSSDRTAIVLFDVVMYPLERSVLSLNDLLVLRPEIGQVLERLGLRFSPALSDEAMASEYGYQARLELDAMIRAQIEQDAARDPKNRRPNAVLNRERFMRVERNLALKIIYFADCSNPESEEDESAGLGRYYRTQADQAWASIGPLKYDADEDLVVDTVEDNVGRVVFARRVQ
ncbi:MAG: hypothetical protein RMA76_38160 [Deltaproteobacteria bacterium]|jgi:hypothetical protein